ncbi:hypothetical protein OHB01_27695 [Microbispora hainanensis]|uniref:hypothetical protein n=1 Tax=Microbispora TaxID=2005 RepID=UPI00115786ED|nr:MULTISPECIES: hypothetical protein [Microbispora]NJP26340.1 hypothetical protein [Microbispora sp. CL1-1]TQS12435.1 hypothetical protein FLW53_19465 [Microbispora sp. SCL1-1]
MPYMMAGEVATALWRPTGDPLLPVQPLIFIGVLPAVAVTGLLLPIRAFEAAAARVALETIETSARNALDELDHVIGVLREGAGRASPEPSLDDLPTLLDAAVTGDRPVVRRLGDLSGVPPVISREAYRVAQEALTNAIRHGTGPIEVDAGVRDRVLEMRVRNEVGASRRRTLTGSHRRGRSGGTTS